MTPSTTAAVSRILSFLILYNTFFISSASAQTASTTTSATGSSETLRVDDASADISYDPGSSSSGWTPLTASDYACSSQASSCITDSLKLNRIYQETLHQARGSASLTYEFEGTGLDVYVVLDNRSNALLNLAFQLDGQSRTPFSYRGSGLNDELGWKYDYSVFSASNLANGKHRFAMTQTDNGSAMMLDYLVVTGSQAISSQVPSSDSVTPTTTVISMVPSESSTIITGPSSTLTSLPPTGVSTPTSANVVTPRSSARLSTHQTAASATGSSTQLPSTPAPSSPSVAVVATAASLVAAAVLIMAVLLYLRWRGQRQKPRRSSLSPEHGPNQPGGSTSFDSWSVFNQESNTISPVPRTFSPAGQYSSVKHSSAQPHQSLFAQIDQMIYTNHNNGVAPSIISGTFTTRRPSYRSHSPDHTISHQQEHSVSEDSSTNGHQRSSSEIFSPHLQGNAIPRTSMDAPNPTGPLVYPGTRIMMGNRF